MSFNEGTPQSLLNFFQFILFFILVSKRNFLLIFYEIIRKTFFLFPSKFSERNLILILISVKIDTIFVII